MSETSERYRKVAAQFTERVQAVPDGAWDNPAPCQGWVARDVVRHLVEWVPGFLLRFDLEMPPAPSVDDDPRGAWAATDSFVQTCLDDPAVATREADSPMGVTTVEKAAGSIVVGDVLVHTWDLARAAGLDERLDPDEVRRLFGMMEMAGDLLRQGGAFGPAVPVPDTADAQTKLIALSGRQP